VRPKMEADLYMEAGTEYASAWMKMTKQIHPPSYPPSLEVFHAELSALRAGRARTSPTEPADQLIDRAKKRK
jgi:hypothetical protein